MYLQYPHLFQTRIWSDFQKALGKTVFYESGDGWQFYAVLEDAEGSKGLLKRLYVPYGPIYNDESSKKAAFSAIEQLAKAQKADYIRVEPLKLNPPQDTTFIGYGKMPKSFQPELTHYVDISQPEDSILADFGATNRRTWKTADQNGHSFEIVTDAADMQDFLRMMHATAARTSTKMRDDAYLKTLLQVCGASKQSGIAYVSHEGKRLGGSLFVDDLVSKTRYYMYTGTFDEARNVRVSSTLVTFMMMDARSKGMQYFDFFGIAPADAPESHPWYGFSVFKRSYGGVDIQFSGTWEKPLHKQKYFIMKLARTLANKR